MSRTVALAALLCALPASLGAQRIRVAATSRDGATGIPGFAIECPPGSRLTALHVRAGWWIDGVGISCADAEGRQSEHSAGGSGGTLHRFELQPGERLRGIQGSVGGEAGPFIYSLNFLTDRRSSPSYGNEGPHRGLRQFALRIPAGSSLVGVHGAANEYLHAIGPIIEPLPADVASRETPSERPPVQPSTPTPTQPPTQSSPTSPSRSAPDSAPEGRSAAPPARPVTSPTLVPLDSVVQVVLGSAHTCASTFGYHNVPGAALRAAQQGTWCWGDNRYGQLGTGDRSPRASPTRVLGAEQKFRELVAGPRSTCAVATSSAERPLWCWGGNAAGELGFAPAASHEAPLAVPAGSRYRAVQIADGYACATIRAGTPIAVDCWGNGVSRVLGLPVPAPGEASRVPFIAELRAGEELAIGDTHACVRYESGEVHCWGDNSFGQLGDGTTTSRTTPARVRLPIRPGRVHVGRGFTCVESAEAFRDTGTPASEIWCWGDNREGQLGNGTNLSSSTPVRTGARGALALGERHACAVDRSRTVRCWGANESGQLGDGSTVSRSTPVLVSGGLRFGTVVASDAHTCALLWPSGRRLYCWGSNAYGQVGHASP